MKYLVLATLLALPAAGQAKEPAAPPVAVVPKAGATVIGKDNQPAGTITQVTADAIVIDTGTNQVPVPVAAVGANPKGLWIGMTRAELDAAFVQATQQARANFAAQLTPGKMVHGLNDVMIGTIKAADAQFVTVTTAKGDVRLPVSGFGPGPDANTVKVGATAEQVEAALGGAGSSGAATPAGAAAPATSGTPAAGDNAAAPQPSAQPTPKAKPRK